MTLRNKPIAIALIILPMTIIQAQSLDSALAYFPMSIGNKWQYAHYIAEVGPSFLQGYSILNVIGDSTMSNGRKYYITQEGPSLYSYFPFMSTNPAYLRIDSATANIYAADPSVAAGELLWDSLLASPRDGSVSGRYLLGVRNDTILGVSTVTRVLNFGPGGSDLDLSYNLGPVYSAYYPQDEFARIDKLVYARIGGHEYGTLVSVTTTAQTTPRQFELSQNYPNPFNPSTIIRYALQTTSHVKLSVFNTLGQSVATMVNESQDAGYHDVKFDGTGLASGVYIYRLVAGDYVSTKKLVILK